MKSSSRRLLFNAALTLLATLALSVSSYANAKPKFQAPFQCNKSWLGKTYAGHNPVNAIDLYPGAYLHSPIGAPVVASASGKVVESKYSTTSGYGNYIVVDHGGGWKTRYAHLDKRLVGVTANVSQGQQLGTLGKTTRPGNGGMTPHLHYEQIYNGQTQKIVWNNSAVPYPTHKQFVSKNCNGSGGAATGTVRTSGAALNVRSGPSTGYSIVGSLNNGSKVTIYCQINGQSITGTYGTSKLWNRIGAGRYIPDAYTYTGSNGRVAPDC